MTDTNVSEGKIKQAQGLMMDAAADVTGSSEGHAKGTLKQVEGKIQEAVGHAVDAVKEAIHKHDQKS